MSLVMVMAMMGRDLTNPEDVSHMIGFSVRWAVPFIFLVVATSSLQKLFPGPVPGWLLRNRKYTGLCFAVAMGWQGLFIFMMTNVHRGYYFEEIFFLRDELEGSTGYLFLAGMVVTSFAIGRKRLAPKQWRLLHLSGLKTRHPSTPCSTGWASWPSHSGSQPGAVSGSKRQPGIRRTPPCRQRSRRLAVH